MKATIWHNPACGTSRKTLAILQETPGVELSVVEYLKTPPSRDELLRLIATMKMPDLTAADMDAAVRTIAGSARSMGIDVEGVR